MIYFFLIVCAYVVGSIPTGFIIGRLRGVTDITRHGSGSIGATNAARVLGMRYFFLVFAVDFLKSFFFIRYVLFVGSGDWTIVAVALALLIGNGWSLFLNFKGGKGIATSVGIVTALQPLFILSLFIIWALFFIVFKTVGIASIAVLIAMGAVAWLVANSMPYMVLYYLIVAAGLFFHRSNMVNQIIIPVYGLFKGSL